MTPQAKPEAKYRHLRPKLTDAQYLALKRRALDAAQEPSDWVQALILDALANPVEEE